jgi:hypothetical protein
LSGVAGSNGTIYHLIEHSIAAEDQFNSSAIGARTCSMHYHTTLSRVRINRSVSE